MALVMCIFIKLNLSISGHLIQVPNTAQGSCVSLKPMTLAAASGLKLERLADRH